LIASLRGRLLHKEADSVVVDVHGVRFLLFIPLRTFYDLPEQGEEVSLEVHMVVREDSIQLFGFLTPSEKEAFVSLLGVNGIGPKLARNILSGIRPQELAQAVLEGSSLRLHAIPGVGRRMAERILLELQGKVDRFMAGRRPEVSSGRRPGEGDGMERDVLCALLNLGYRKSEAAKVLPEARRQIRGPATAEAWIRESLKLLIK